MSDGDEALLELIVYCIKRDQPLDSASRELVERLLALAADSIETMPESILDLPAPPQFADGWMMGKAAVRDGLKLCEHAVKIQYYEPDNHLNLARVQLMTSDRKAAVASIARGLKLDPNHRGLKELRVEIGVRRRPVIPFLSRNNLFNQVFGRLRHKISGR